VLEVSLGEIVNKAIDLFRLTSRLAKEVDLYKKEHSEQKVVVEKLSGVDEDEWELKNAVRRRFRPVTHPILLRWHACPY
jgi:hypothetical protein